MKKDENDNESQIGGETVDGQPKLRAHLSRRPHRDRDPGDFFIYQQMFHREKVLMLRKEQESILPNFFSSETENFSVFC